MNDEQGHGPNMVECIQDMLLMYLHHFVQRVAGPLLGNAFELYQQDSAFPAIANEVEIQPRKHQKFFTFKASTFALDLVIDNNKFEPINFNTYTSSKSRGFNPFILNKKAQAYFTSRSRSFIY